MATNNDKNDNNKQSAPGTFPGALCLLLIFKQERQAASASLISHD